jgi:2-polyprenyl-6-methoxyphenol hydroxylase-like FAD-dependent oxidoreductase
MSPFQGQGANMAMLDALKLAQALATGGDLADVEQDIVKRGRKAVLDSRRAAEQFHTRSRFARVNRNVGFHVANFFIKTFASRPKAPRAATA